MPVLDRLPRLAELAVSGARKAGSLGASAARDIADGVRRRRQAQQQRSGAVAERQSAEQPSAPEPAAAAPEPAASAAEPAAAAPAAAQEPAAPAPDHVDREAVVVAESADPGASGTVGAQVTIDEPWDGYGELSAQQVVARLEDASAEALVVVRLYEQTQRDRADVLEAIDRRLAAISE